VSERIEDRELGQAVMASVGAILPGDEHWTVIVDGDGQPIAAIAPGGGVATDLVVAEASLPIVDAFESDALRDSTSETAVVVMRGPSVVGVWSGDDLVDAAMHGGTRGEALAGDMVLPGLITKKDITRRCRHTDGGRACATILVEPEKPEVMPACPAQAGVSPHSFEW
jgi:hypothetical protein